MTLDEFLEEHEVATVFREGQPRRSDMTSGFKYSVRFKRGDEAATFTFHDSIHNMTHNKRASAADVLECLLSDASVAESCSDADDVAEEFGYTKPSEAIRIYNGCVETRDKLRLLLGPALYEKAMYEVER